VNVCTIEDPIEMVEPSFNQMQVQHGIDLGFADGVRALMRQDPDIIMVGEIRDLETAEMAIQAALTGHLVLSTLHTNDAPSAITRLLDLGVPPYLLNATVLGVMAQRLVRTLCPHCKRAGTEDDADDEGNLGSPGRPWKARPAAAGVAHRRKGCLECRMTGYIGRVGIYEILTDERRELREKFVTGHRHSRPRRIRARSGDARGHEAAALSAAMKVGAGLTTIEEVMKVAPPGISSSTIRCRRSCSPATWAPPWCRMSWLRSRCATSMPMCNTWKASTGAT
jgi:general secretion pathway protein E